jgi:hypothetical protein
VERKQSGKWSNRAGREASERDRSRERELIAKKENVAGGNVARIEWEVDERERSDDRTGCEQCVYILTI